MSYRITRESRGSHAVAALDADPSVGTPGGGAPTGPRPLIRQRPRQVPSISVQPVSPPNFGGVRIPDIVRVTPPRTGPILVSASRAPVRLGPGTVRVPVTPGMTMPKYGNRVVPSRVMPIPGATPAPVIIEPPPASSSSGGGGGGGGGGFYPGGGGGGGGEPYPDDAFPEDLLESAAPAAAQPKKSHLGLIVAGAAAIGVVWYLTKGKKR